MEESVSSSDNEEFLQCHDTTATEMTLSKIIADEDMRLITSEFTRLGDRCYLENAGTVLYPQSLLQRVNEDLSNNIYMNPHTDKYTKDCIEQIRYTILRHFNTDNSEYSVIFTSGATQGLKLIVESFQFNNEKGSVGNCGSFVYLRDNHTSVIGLREIAAEKHADIIQISHDDFVNKLDLNCNFTLDPAKANTVATKIPNLAARLKSGGNNLFVFPAQSNFNGYKYPLQCINEIKAGCLNKYSTNATHKKYGDWYTLLDSAAYVPSNRLDLSLHKPDFVTLSFYKMFGYPTGLGAIILKNSSSHILDGKRYFGGGTVDVVLSAENFHIRRKDLAERFEDGTQSFLGIIALKHCFNFINEMIPRMPGLGVMDTISYHTFYLAQDLYNQLMKLEHMNGSKAAILYHDSDFTDISKQGGVVTFNLLRHDKSYIGYSEFQHMADLFEINVRTGCFCNSGSCQRHLNATDQEIIDMYSAGHKCGDDLDLINGKPTGAVRVSFAYYNTYEDVDTLMNMICRCFVLVKYEIPKRRRHISNEFKPKKNGDLLKEVLKQEPVFVQNIQKVLMNPAIAPAYRKHKITLREMAIFPIKSCGAFKVQSSWNIGRKGFKYDREWMIVKDNGVCLTQKQNPQMCLIKPTIDLNNMLLILNFPGKHQISVPIDIMKSNAEIETTFCQTRVCADTVKGIDCGDEVANWISEALEISFLRLIRQSDSDKRTLKSHVNGVQKMLNLSNQAQFLLINTATVRWLSNKIRDPEFTNNLDELTDRFRGNLIIDSDKELVETEWRTVIIGKQEFKVEGPCSRCQMVCIDQSTGIKTVEPLRTISELFAGKLRFGIYLSYAGAIDGSNDGILKSYSSIKPFLADPGIGR